MALGALAVLILLAIWGHGRWQEHRALRSLRERLHGGLGADPLLEPLRRAEPTGGVGGPGSGLPDDAVARARRPASGNAGDGEEPSEPSPSASSEPLRRSQLHPSDWEEDPQLDFSLELRCAHAVDGVAVIDAVAPLATPDWPQAVHFVVWDARHQGWVLPDRFGYYTEALASIQMGSRSGALDAATLERFVRTVREIARVLDADVDLPDEPRVLAQARELDELCARFDIRVALTLRPGQNAWTGPQVRSAVGEEGWETVAPQRWVLRNAADEIEFILDADSHQPTALALELDVPRVADPVGAMAEMARHAGALAAALGGLVVDDNGHPIDAASLLPVQEQLATVVDQMREAGIDPGSERARRLYGQRWTA